MKSILLVLMLMLNCGCGAKPDTIGPLPSSVPAADTKSAHEARELRWNTEKWTGSDQPFIQVRDQINLKLKQGISVNDLLDGAESNAVKNPYAPTAQYAWCYLALKAVKAVKYPDGRDTAYVRLQQRLYDATEGMIFGTQPRSYEFSRLLFLGRMEDSRDTAYAQIGHRLIERNADDGAVRRQLILLDTDSFYPPHTQEALDYTRYFYRKTPNAPGFYMTLGDIYFSEFLAHKQSGMADKALENWHKSFQISPPSQPVREDIQRNIRWIQTVEAKQKHQASGH